MATTDLHMHILPYDYLADRPVNGWGLTNTARLIAKARAEQPNTLLFDNGDFLHGTPMGDMVVEQYRAASGSQGQPVHPMIAAMNNLSYDAGTLGNHDFDRGIGVLFDAIEQAEFPIISTNTVVRKAETPLQDTTLVPPFALLDRWISDADGAERSIRIGVVGFLPPGSLRVGHNRRGAPQTRDIVDTAMAYVPHVKARGADIVVALAHSGLGEETHCPCMENALGPLSRVAGIDAIIGGHAHQVFPDPSSQALDENGLSARLNEVPTIVPGFWGSHLGVIDLELEVRDTVWRVVSARAELREVHESRKDRNGAAQDQKVPNWLAHLHETTLSHMRKPIAQTRHCLENHFALVGADRATRLVQEAMQLHAQRFQDRALGWNLPVLASSAAFKSGGLAGPGYYTNVPKGQLTQRSLSDLYVFPNALTLIRASGAYLRDWLERSASLYNLVQAGACGVALKDDGTPGYLFESILGLSYDIDLSQPARFSPDGVALATGGGRVRDLCHDGQPVRDADEFLFATSDFRACGGGGYPVAPDASVIAAPPTPIREIVRSHVERVEAVDIPADPVWRFASVPGASVRFKSSPVAWQHHATYPWLSLRRVHSCDDDGFAHYELQL